MIRKLTQDFTEDIDKVGLAATLLIVLAATPFIVFLVPQFMGLDAYVVSSGSMEPSMPTGSIVYNEEVLPSTIEVADVITFVSNETGQPQEVTHRVIELNETEEGLQFKTKGDANPEPDEGWVDAEDVLGKKAFSIPYMGYALTFLSSPVALILMLIIPAAVLIRRHMQTLIENLDDTEDEEDYYYYSQ